MQFQIYSLIKRTIPQYLKNNTYLLSPVVRLRDYFWKTSYCEWVEWQDLKFKFTAPYPVLYRAKNFGIENRILRLARQTLREGQSAIDVGANYGFLSCVIGLSLKNGGRLLAFEIDKTVCLEAQNNINLNSLQNVAKIVCKGASKENSNKLITVDQQVTEDRLTNIAFFKVDVDGLEYDVLLGADKMIRTNLPVIVVEINKQATDIYHYLFEIGYRYFINLNNEQINLGNLMVGINLVASVEPINVPGVILPNIENLY